MKGLASRWRNDELHSSMAGVEGAVRRNGDGHMDQWEVIYKDWIFVASFYEDGSQLWSAFYKVPAFEWSTPEDKERGFSWGGGVEVEKVAPNLDPNKYLQLLKRMADKNPNVWKSRSVPKMPKL